MIILAFVLALVIPGLVSAQSTSVGSSLNATVTPKKTRADIQAEIDLRRASATERREERQENIDERRASATAKRIEVQQNIAKRQVEHVSKVMLATIERLEKIIARIESRISKLKAEGGNVSESESFVALAKTDLAEAEVLIEAFVSIDLSSDKAQENFKRIREAAAKAREEIRSARTNLMKAVRLLGSVNAEVRTATSTDSDD